MTPFTTAIIAKALDGLTARATATAENIANAGTPNYRPLRVSFEAALAAAAKTGRKADVVAVRPNLSEDATADGLRVDRELATAAATAMRYSALVELMSRHFQMESESARGGA